MNLLRSSPTASLSVPVLNHPHPEEVLFWNPTGFPLLGLSTGASCVYPELSMGNTGNSRRQSSTCELKLPSCISYLSPCKEIQVTVLPRLALHYTTWNCLHYCSSSEGEISELHVGILSLAVPYVPDFLNSVFERVLVVQLYPLYLYCFMLVYVLGSLYFFSAMFHNYLVKILQYCLSFPMHIFQAL